MENILLKENGKINTLEFSKMQEFKDKVEVIVSVKPTNCIEENYLSKYESIAEILGVHEKDILRPRQLHTDNIVEINSNDQKLVGPIDGLITLKKNIPIATTFADCMPLFIYDPIQNVIANIHSGWRGTIKRIGCKAIEILSKKYDCKPRNLICLIGPCIRKEHFLVNDDVREIFEYEFKDICKNYNIISKTDKFNEKGIQYEVDAVEVNKILLKNLGIDENNIIDCNLCTVCYKEKFHSRRVEGPEYKVNTGVMMLK